MVANLFQLFWNNVCKSTRPVSFEHSTYNCSLRCVFRSKSKGRWDGWSVASLKHPLNHITYVHWHDITACTYRLYFKITSQESAIDKKDVEYHRTYEDQAGGQMYLWGCPVTSSWPVIAFWRSYVTWKKGDLTCWDNQELKPWKGNISTSKQAQIIFKMAILRIILSLHRLPALT